MQLSLLLIVAPLLALAAPEREAPPTREVKARDETATLGKRACNPVGCECAPGYAGVYCANCLTSSGGWVVPVLGSGTTSDVYQCDGNGGCCDYGYANDCAGGATGRCG
ncbi:uncharacterized protein DNG_02586 [Cephalotrichum gorgonifer]|uniref:Uncharacterized protein n=1 Tax=Cephalotrichum gorgonifer TaxID=2041049 RepID=A0AAE8MV28_9PEZI|nr:uncharacterized protein DNG_02586 [Cephalotrichum gorgonifer]